MTKIYVAGKNMARSRSMMNLLAENGHTITFDWLIDFETNTAEHKNKPLEELEAVRACEVLVYLWEPDQESARYEAGMAMGLGKKLLFQENKNNGFLICQI